MKAPLFGFRGIYANIYNNSTTTDPTWRNNTQRAAAQTRCILASGATVGCFIESGLNNWNNDIIPKLPNWDFVGGASGRVVAWDTTVWTYETHLVLPMESLVSEGPPATWNPNGKDIVLCKLRYEGNAANYVWFVAAHHSPYVEPIRYEERMRQSVQLVAAIKDLGTDRWIAYSDVNEYKNRVLNGPSSIEYMESQGWIDQYMEPGMQLANAGYDSLQSWVPPRKTVPGPMMIDFIFTQGSNKANPIKALQHVRGEQIMHTWAGYVSDVDDVNTLVPSDHNWHSLTTMVLR